MITQKKSKTALIVGFLCLWHATSAFAQNLLPRYSVMVMSIVLYCLGLITSNAALAGGFITMQPQDAFVDRGNSLHLIATFRPVGNSSTDWGIMVAYEWKFQRSTDGQESVIKSGLWRGVGAFELLIPNATDNHAGNYRIVFQNKHVPKSVAIESRWAIVTVGDGGSTVTPVIHVTPPVIAPSITRQPQSQAVLVGTRITLFVNAAGTQPLSYLWRKNGVSISGATSSSFTIGNIQTTHAGNYTVAVRNSGGITSSLNAVLTVTSGGITLPHAYTFTTLAGSTGSSGDTDGIGSAARFNSPIGVAVDNESNVYVVDYGNSTIRKILTSGVVSTLAGTEAKFKNPRGVAIDNAGIVYVADWGNHTIVKIEPSGMVSTLAGLAGSTGSTDGAGSAARFYGPTGVATDSAGNVYVADEYNHTIRKIASDGEVTTLAGLAGITGSTDGRGSEARFNNPFGVATDSAGNVYVADYSNHTIRKITSGGAVSTLAGLTGSGGSVDGTVSEARFYYPLGIAVDKEGNVYVGDSNNTIRKITPSGVVSTLGGWPGKLGSVDGLGSEARFASPYGVAVDNEASIYVADFQNRTIRKGVPSAWWSGALLKFSGIHRMPNGSYLISMEGLSAKKITLYTSTNLVDWLPFMTFLSSQDSFQFEDPPAVVFKQRFYRVVAQ